MYGKIVPYETLKWSIGLLGFIPTHTYNVLCVKELILLRGCSYICCEQTELLQFLF